MEIKELHSLVKRSAGVTTDSRKIEKGELFFALRGPSFNGNEYAASALETGALAAVVDDPSLKGGGYIVVDDVLEALRSVARYHRSTLTIPVLGITGTNGKTTTKELVAAVMAKKEKVHKTPGNLNNHIGVPLSILNAPENCTFLIVEMGANHMGEIADLCSIAQPTHGIITNISRAHIEGFGSFENVIATKSELYRWLNDSGGTALYNDNNPLLKELVYSIVSKAVPYSAPGGPEIEVRDAGSGSLFLEVAVHYEGAHYRFPTDLFGAYNIDNIRAAFAAGIFFGIPVTDIIEAVSSYKPVNNRSQVMQTGKNTIICDSYNANPASMEKAISSFIPLDSAEKMIILGDMLELGAESGNAHHEIVSKLSSLKIHDIILVGPQFREAAAGTGIRAFEDIAEAAEWIRHRKPHGFTVLVKGSRGMALEKLYPLL